MKNFLIILFIFFSFFHCFSQVDKIKEASSSNKSIISSESKSPKSSNSCLDACNSCCIDLFLVNIIPLTIDLQKKYLKRKNEIKRIISFDTYPLFCFNSRSSYNIYPRIRGNWGLFSSDIRYTSLIEENDFWNTFDWQIFQVNWIILKEFNLRTGIGFMYELFSKKSFPEYTVTADFYLLEKYNPTIEFRLSDDINSFAIPRIEISLVVNYKIIEQKNFSINLSVGTNFQNYYKNILTNNNGIKYWGFITGFLFNFY